MYFELSREVIDQIIFAMEDQQSTSYVNAQTGIVLRADRMNDSAEVVPVPDWKPVDGFHLMERFVADLHNPVFRDMLRDALASGRGVFRAFKNTLKGSPEIERLWYAFKEREMKRIVVEWYNAGRELRGLEKLGPEPEDTGELVAMDFVLVTGDEHRDAVLALDRQAFTENLRLRFADVGEEKASVAYELARAGEPALDAAETRLTCTETPSGELAGFVWGVVEEQPVGGTEWRVVQLAVSPAFRGLGVATRLLSELTRQASNAGAQFVTVTLTGESLKATSFFDRTGFVERNRVLELDLDSDY